MEIKNVHLSKDKLKMSFILANTNAAYANVLRRAIISLVPVLAIEDVEFFENNSALYDEVIAHRLALLPLTTDLESYILPDPKVQDGVSRASSEVKLTLDAKGPCTVYAEDFKSKDPKVKCAFPKTTIVKLLKNQSLKLEATALLGQGTAHMKWSAGTAFYQNLPIIKDGSKTIEVTPKDIADARTNEVFVLPDGSLNIPVTKSKNVSIEQSQTDFLFTIESWGQHKPSTMLKEALNQVDKVVDELQKAVQAVGKE